MAISYNNLWKILIDKEMNKGALCSKAKISKGTMAKMTNNEPVTLTVIEKYVKCFNVISGMLFRL